MNGKAYEVNPASLLNQERLIEDDAMELTLPADPMYANPCERSESLVPFSVVEENDIKPLAWLKTDDVEIPYDVKVSKSCIIVKP